MIKYLSQSEYLSAPQIGAATMLFFCDTEMTQERMDAFAEKMLKDKIRKICFVGASNENMHDSYDGKCVEMFDEGKEPVEFALGETELEDGIDCWRLTCLDNEEFNVSLIVFETEHEREIAKKYLKESV